jgi:4a-hydroxytetrahydrobiopterin dehydratase
MDFPVNGGLMDELIQDHCIPIKPNTPKLIKSEINQLIAQLPGWRIYEKDGEPRLEKSFKFENFKQAAVFTAQIAVEADKEDHHPTILTEWGRVTITWWTHRIKGLHQNDFIMAARTDQLYKEYS